jgi:hypothetical protein
MPIRFGRRTEPKATTGLRDLDAAVLKDGVLYARWYILRRLDEEVERARRYQRPLSIAVAAPMLIPGETPTALELEVAAAAARAAARSTDLLGWMASDSILMIMPETLPDGARSAVFRWREDMRVHTRGVGGHLWRAVAIQDAHSYESAEQLVRAAAERLAGNEAA